MCALSIFNIINIYYLIISDLSVVGVEVVDLFVSKRGVKSSIYGMDLFLCQEFLERCFFWTLLLNVSFGAAGPTNNFLLPAVIVFIRWRFC